MFGTDLDSRTLLLVDLTLKATILLIAAWLCARAAWRCSAAVRHYIWAMAICGLIVLLPASNLIPGWRMPIYLPENQPNLRVELTESLMTPSSVPARTVSAARPRDTSVPIPSQGTAITGSVPKAISSSAIEATPSEGIPGNKTAESVTQASPRTPWTLGGILLVVWSLGVLVVALPTLFAICLNEVRRRRLRLVTESDWRELLEQTRHRYAIRRSVELRWAGNQPIPATWGVGRPVVALPSDADLWPMTTRRVVLLHELAHVSRFDAGFQLVGRLACALFWFHPLAWYALHRLRLECEHACDDCVVQAGERPTDYAEKLLRLARAVRTDRFSAVLAMARPNTLEVRMKAIFNRECNHQPLNRRTAQRFTGVLALLVFVMATAHPGPRASESDEPSKNIKDEPKGSGRITGRAVRATEGTPVANAEIVLLPPPPKGENVYIGKLPLRGTKADTNGAFAFEGLAPGRYTLWANSGKLTSKTGHIRGDTVVIPESGENPKPVDLKLKPGVRLTAHVKDKSTGKPIVGATVKLGWSDFLTDQKTDIDGVAVVEPLMKERALFEVVAEGYAKSSRWMSLETGTDVEEEFSLAPGGSLTGIVRDQSGKPVEGVGFGLRAEGGSEQLEYVVSGKDGRFRMSHVPIDIGLEIGVGKDGYVSETLSATQAVRTGSTLDIKIKPIPNGGSIVGVVLDPKGKPVAGAELTNMGNSTALVRETKSGADGRFRLDNLYENFAGKEVLVRAKGFAPKRVKVQTGPSDTPNEVRIELETGHRIIGRVVDEKGKPISRVYVYYADGNHGFSDGGRTETDKDGNFSFDTLPPDTPFTFVKQGFSQIEGRKLTLDGKAVVEVVMIPSGAIVGKVFDGQSGKPVTKFNVRITFSPKRRNDEPSSGLLTSWTDPGLNYQSNQGEFRFGDLVSGMPLQVTVTADGYEKHVAERIVAVRGDRAPTEEFRLDPVDPATLCLYQGRIRSADGKPVAGAQVHLIASRERRPGKDRAAFPYNWQMIRTGQIAQQAAISRFLEITTDKDGKFAFKNIPKDHEVELVWWGKGIASGRADHLELREEKERLALEIDLPSPGKVTGVVDREAFGPVARVQITPATDLSLEEVTLELKKDQLEFEIGDLAPGVYHVQLYSPYERAPGGGNGLSSRVVARGQVTVDAGGTSRIEFR